MTGGTMGEVCEVCGLGGRVVEATVPTPDGGWIRLVIHLVCENERVARHAQRRAVAAWN